MHVIRYLLPALLTFQVCVIACASVATMGPRQWLFPSIPREFTVSSLLRRMMATPTPFMPRRSCPCETATKVPRESATAGGRPRSRAAERRGTSMPCSLRRYVCMYVCMPLEISIVTFSNTRAIDFGDPGSGRDHAELYRHGRPGERIRHCID